MCKRKVGYQACHLLAMELLCTALKASSLMKLKVHLQLFLEYRLLKQKGNWIETFQHSRSKTSKQTVF